MESEIERLLGSTGFEDLILLWSQHPLLITTSLEPHNRAAVIYFEIIRERSGGHCSNAIYLLLLP